MVRITAETIATRIRLEATRGHFSIAALARQTGMSRAAMRAIVHGRVFPSARLVVALAALFEVSPAYLLGIDDEL